jgi:serine/threonine protein kinase
LIKKRGYLTELETRYFMKQLVSAVEYMHSKGVMHRDLKAGNVFISDLMQLKVGDFGLAV